MRFYRIHLYDLDGSHGFEWYVSREAARKAVHDFDALARDAKRNADDPTKIEEIDVQPTKHGIFQALITYATHPDNG